MTGNKAKLSLVRNKFFAIKYVEKPKKAEAVVNIASA